MNQLSNNSVVVTVKKRRSTRRRLGNGEVPNAEHDADVARLISAELEKRSATRHAMIAEAAYYRAQKRGFAAGHELDDWLAAEREIDSRMQQ